MFNLPIGPDRADGVTPLPANPVSPPLFPSPGGAALVGTATPAGARQVDSQQGLGTEVTLEEEVDSPEMERAEQATFQHRLTMDYEIALQYWGMLGRGTYVADSAASALGVQTIWRILSSRIKSKRGDIAELHYTAESISFDSPPDDFDIQPVDLGLDLLKHPRYAWALNPIANDNTTFKQVNNIQIFYTDIKSAIIRMIQTYRDSPVFPSADQINGLLHTNIMSAVKGGNLDVHYNNPTYNPNPVSPQTVDAPVRWNGVNPQPSANCPYFIVGVPVSFTDPTDPIYIAISAAKEIISKLWRQEDTPYMPGWEVTWAQYFFLPVFLDGGAYIQSPVGIVPDYFMDPLQNGTTNLFAQLSKTNPQAFGLFGMYGDPVNISWLRKADRMEYQRTWFKVTRTWIGSPIGTWDTDLYKAGAADGSGNRPQLATDFSQLI